MVGFAALAVNRWLVLLIRWHRAITAGRPPFQSDFVGVIRMRRFFPWSLAGLAFGLAILEAVAFEPNRLRVKRVKLLASGRGVPSVDLRLAHLSDLHVGGTGWRRGPISRAIRVCNQERLDLIVITGDLIGSESGAEVALEMLSSLRRDVPRLAVLGNHDYVH